MLVASDIDEYSQSDLLALEFLVRDPRLRVIATARRLSGSVARIANGFGANKVSLGPLDLEESEQYLSALLGVDRIETETLRRWYDSCDGNSYALTVLALASDRSGRLRRSRGTAWVAADVDAVPTELADAVAGNSTAEEWETLELVAIAEPVLESALLREFDANCLHSLFERGLVVSRSMPDGSSALVIGHPLLAAALRAGMPPLRRIELHERVFEALDRDRGAVNPVHLPERLMRLVVFGLEGERILPFDWLWAALELASLAGDPRLKRRLALAVAHRPEAEPAQVGRAILRAIRVTRLTGDSGGHRSTLALAEELLADGSRSLEQNEMLRTSLHLELIVQDLWDGVSEERVLERFDELDREVAGRARNVVEQAVSIRALSLATMGRLREGFEIDAAAEPVSDLGVEWSRAPMRAIASLVLAQRGEIARGISNAENTRMLCRLGSRVGPDTIELLGFAWLFGYWAEGAPETMRQVLEDLKASTRTEARYSGLLELGEVLLAMLEGRWREAAQTAEWLLDRFSQHDAYGTAPLVHAALALSSAVLGERDTAERAIRAASVLDRGMGLVLGGYRRVLLLRARQWLHDGNVVAEARDLARWAEEEGLALIEMFALHVIAFGSPQQAGEVAGRARELRELVDPHLGEALAAHIERLATGIGSAPVLSDEPEVRRLADFGIWLPLSPTSALTSREREVVLLAALGHSSRFISERLFISARTVETHLSNSFSKLEVVNRDELRVWAHRDRVARFEQAIDT